MSSHTIADGRPPSSTLPTSETRSHLYIYRFPILESSHLGRIRDPTFNLNRLHLVRPALHYRTRSHRQWRQARRCMEVTGIYSSQLEGEVQTLQARAHDCIHSSAGDSQSGGSG
jgi:hypothetical protein